MSKKKYEGIYPALKILFDMSTERQEELLKSRWYSNISTMSYLKEFCTIKIMTARRSGHDYGLSKLLYESRLRSLVLSPNSQISYNFIGTCQRVSGVTPNFIINSTYYIIDRHRWANAVRHHTNIDIVAVNPSFGLSKSLEEKLYRNIAETTFLLRGSEDPFYIIFVE